MALYGIFKFIASSELPLLSDEVWFLKFAANDAQLETRWHFLPSDLNKFIAFSRGSGYILPKCAGCDLVH